MRNREGMVQLRSWICPSDSKAWVHAWLVTYSLAPFAFGVREEPCPMTGTLCHLGFMICGWGRVKALPKQTQPLLILSKDWLTVATSNLNDLTSLSGHLRATMPTAFMFHLIHHSWFSQLNRRQVMPCGNDRTPCLLRFVFQTNLLEACSTIKGSFLIKTFWIGEF